MTTLAQDSFNRALALNDSNQAFASMSASEVLARLNYAQGELFARLAEQNRTYYLTKQSIPSSVGGSQRTLDLNALNPALERVLIIFLPGGVVLNVVDVQDQDAELAPRAFPFGAILQEIGNEWSGVSGAVTMTVWYVFHPAQLNLSGDLTQALTVPDQFAAYFDYDLAWYMANKDPGRVGINPGELDRLSALRDAAFTNIMRLLDHFTGVMSHRFLLPVPKAGEKA